MATLRFGDHPVDMSPSGNVDVQFDEFDRLFDDDPSTLEIFPDRIIGAYDDPMYAADATLTFFGTFDDSTPQSLWTSTITGYSFDRPGVPFQFSLLDLPARTIGALDSFSDAQWDAWLANNPYEIFGSDYNDYLGGSDFRLADTIHGLGGDDTLDGGRGADALIGGGGNDVYVVDNGGDTVTELPGEGTDEVRSWVSFHLGDDIENLLLLGTGSVKGEGNALANVLTGNAGSNILDGGAGADTMAGGRGNDVYIVDAVGDAVSEDDPRGGVDRVESSVAFVLGAYLENLTLTGGASVDATGNALSNVLIGNAGDNRLDGGLGNDVMAGGLGNDTYVVDIAGDRVTEARNGGTDRVESSITYLLGNELEHLTLTGSADINGTGNALANQIIGNAGNNNLDGKAGADTMAGGDGDDRYVVDNLGDTVSESPGEGSDTVESAVTFNLPNNVEALILTGRGAFDGTGNGLDNALTGNAYNNTLTGLAGDDTLEGGRGADALIGGVGNDVYVVDNGGDTVTALPGEGTDCIRSSVNFDLSLSGGNVEDLFLLGRSSLSARGDDSANRLMGNAGGNELAGRGGADTLLGGDGNDRLDGGEGNDLLDGGTGRDVLKGGNGADKFWFFGWADSPAGKGDIIDDFEPGVDNIILALMRGLGGGSEYTGIDGGFVGGTTVSAQFVSATSRLQVDLDGSGTFDAGDLEISMNTAPDPGDISFLIFV